MMRPVRNLCFIVLFTFVLPGAAALAQTDSAWVASHYTKHEYRIPMRDGIHLFTAVFVPDDAGERHPFLLMRTPYGIGPYGEDRYSNSTLLLNLTRYYLDRNYIFVLQDVRGRYMSEGTFTDVRPYIPDKTGNADIDESSDAYDTIDWLVKNIPRNNGRVGVKGTSYGGFYTTMAAIDAHPAVKAVSPQAPVSQWMGGDDWCHNGAFLLPHALNFYMGFGWPRPEPTPNDRHPFDEGTPDEYQFYLNLGALSNTWQLTHDSVAFWDSITTHGMWDSFWAKRDVLPRVKNLKPATLIVGGWFDTENLYGTLHLYRQIENDKTGGYHTLVMGPWPHSWWIRNNLDSLGPIKWGMNLSEFFKNEVEGPYFDFFLRDRGKFPLPEALVFETGANEWKRFDQWPPPGLVPARLYLGPGGLLSMNPPEKSKREFDEYISDPAKPVPYTNEIRHWYNVAFMAEDQRFASRRPDVLVYKTPPLDRDVTLAGPMTVHLTGSTSGTDCDWVVKLIDVFPDSMKDPSPDPLNVRFGGYQMLVRGDALRAKFRGSLSAPEPVAPRQPMLFEYPLQDVFHRFKKGHSIMVQVQSTWFPMIDRNPGIFEDIFHAKDSDFRSTVQRVYHSPEHPTYLEVNLFGQ